MEKIDRKGYLFSGLLVVLVIFLVLFDLRGFFGLPLSYVFAGCLIFISFYLYYYLNPRGGIGSKIIFLFWCLLPTISVMKVFITLKEPGLEGLAVLYLLGLAIVSTTLCHSATKILSNNFLIRSSTQTQGKIFGVLLLFLAISIYFAYDNFFSSEKYDPCNGPRGNDPTFIVCTKLN